MWAAGLSLLCAALLPQTGVPSRSAAAAAINELTVAAGGGGAVLTIAAPAALPRPTVGTLDNPSRIYLDFAGVRVKTASMPWKDTPPVTRVRAAQHSVSPLVARVVIDLAQPSSYALDLSRQRDGHIEVTVTPRGTRATAPAPAQEEKAAVPDPAAAPARATTPRGGEPKVVKAPAPERPAAAPPPAPPAAAPPMKPEGRIPRAYLAQVASILAALEAQRPVLQAIDARTTVAADRLLVASAELARVRDQLAGVTPPREVSESHDLLRNAAAMAATAVSLARAAAGGPVPPNAASAAAGAIIFLDRARADLGRQ
jgi:hypothetical protein